MNGTTSTHQFGGLSVGFRLMVGVILLLGLAGCGGGGGSGNQDASGLYKNGTATLDPGGTDLMIFDLRAFVHGNRIIMFSIDEHILVDGQISSINGSDFNATVDLYETGEMTQPNISVSGTVTSQSSISGTLNGTGVGSGNFNLTFDLLYNRGATTTRISAPIGNGWTGLVNMFTAGLATNNFETANSDTTYNFESTNSSSITCSHNGTIAISDSTVNIYSLQESISDAVSCDGSLIATDYSGFAAVVDGVGTDDTLLYAVTNATHSVFAVLSR